MPQTAAPSSSPLTPELLERLHRAGLRVTPATRAVLGLFAADPCAARCHFEVLAQLQARGAGVGGKQAQHGARGRRDAQAGAVQALEQLGRERAG